MCRPTAILDERSRVQLRLVVGGLTVSGAGDFLPDCQFCPNCETVGLAGSQASSHQLALAEDVPGLMLSVSSDTLDDFKAFADASQAVLAAHEQHGPIHEFKRFVRIARPLAAKELRADILRLRPKLDRVCRWMLPHDLLQVAGLSYVENAYTNLIGWAIYPNGDPKLALTCQKAWLSTLGIPQSKHMRKPSKPLTQLPTRSGRPDMVLDCREGGFAVVVEAKTGSGEHLTPQEQMQTVIYPEAVRRALALPESVPVYMVFLTPDGTPAENEEAVNTTYAWFVLAIALAVSRHTLTDPMKWMYSAILTHFLSAACPRRIDGVAAVTHTSELLARQGGDLDDDTVFLHFQHLRDARDLLDLENEP